MIGGTQIFLIFALGPVSGRLYVLHHALRDDLFMLDLKVRFLLYTNRIYLRFFALRAELSYALLCRAITMVSGKRQHQLCISLFNHAGLRPSLLKALVWD